MIDPSDDYFGAVNEAYAARLAQEPVQQPETLASVHFARMAGRRIGTRVIPGIIVVAHREAPPRGLPWLQFRADLDASPHLPALAGMVVRVWDLYPDAHVRRFRDAVRKLPRVSVTLRSEQP